MAANIYKKCVYSFQKPMWHNITEPSLVPMTAEGIMSDKFGSGFPIHTRPITVELNGSQQETGHFAIVRGSSSFDSEETVFGYCTERYHPLQPMDVAKSFDANVCQPAETMAFLGEGNDMFISWKMPGFEVVVGDEVELYGIVRTGFDTLKGTRLFTSVYRPVCANTITLAENWAKNHTNGEGKGNIWKGKAVNKNLLRDLGYWMKHVQSKAIGEAALLQGLFTTLAKQPIHSDGEAKELIAAAYPFVMDVSSYYPPELQESKAERTESINESTAKVQDGIYQLFAGKGTKITPDYWGLLNATSEYFCHYQPSKKPIAESVMFGSRAGNIAQMVNVLSASAR